MSDRVAAKVKEQLDALSDADIDGLLDRFDQTEYRLQRRIIVSGILRSSVAADEIDRLLADNAALRKQVEAHAAHIARASEVIAARAERDALARLEAWQKPTRNHYRIYPTHLELMAWSGGVVAAFSCPMQYATHGPRKDSFGTGRVAADAQCVTVGTDEKPATASEVILAALELWERLYGEQKGGA